jgi:hypothetical protein
MTERVQGLRSAGPWGSHVEGDGGVAQRNVGYVDPVSGDDATGAIGTTQAFATIQGFIDAVPQGNDSASARNVFVAQISPADYDEDLNIDISRRRIILTGPGPWGLGTFGGADWGPSGVPRNIIVTGADANIDGIRPGLVITSNPFLTEGMTTHQSYLTKPRISGMIDFSGAAGIGSIEVGLNCEIFADAGGLAIDAGLAILQSYIYHSRFRGGLQGSNWNFQVSERTRFDGLIDVSGFSLIQSCRINAGLTTASVPPVGIIPGGMVATYFAGTFTGPAASAVMDGYTNYYFKANGAILAGGATKVITDDLVP